MAIRLNSTLSQFIFQMVLKARDDESDNFTTRILLASLGLDLKTFPFSKATSSISIVRYLAVTYLIRVLHYGARIKCYLISGMC